MWISKPGDIYSFAQLTVTVNVASHSASREPGQTYAYGDSIMPQIPPSIVDTFDSGKAPPPVHEDGHAEPSALDRTNPDGRPRPS